MTKPDSELALELDTIALLNQIGWPEWLDCEKEQLGADTLLGRMSQREVVLRPHLAGAIAQLNPQLPPEAIQQACDILTEDRSTLSLPRANQTIWQLLRAGVDVSYTDADGQTIEEKARIIDWDTPSNNRFFLAQQLTIQGVLHTRRPDLIGFVNGLPLLFIELKAHTVKMEDAYHKNLNDYKDTIPHLFWYNALIVLSNGSDARAGSLTASLDHFSQWKRINDEGEQGVIELETLIRATCTPDRLLDITENFTLFADDGSKKIVAKNHQYLGVHNAVQAVHDIEGNHGKLGVFWHTQGSGKSYSMAFFTEFVLRHITGNWTFLIVTDRLDLDDQLYKTFARTGIVVQDEKLVRAQNSQHLQKQLQGNNRYLFTLIQKFQTADGSPYPLLSERSDIIVISDEAHRSQYDTFAQNMRMALPNAAFLGFTGTPLMGDDKRTREVFGDYVSVYNFRQSIEDEATVPLYYENRVPSVQLTNQSLNRDLSELLEELDAEEAQVERVKREFAREYQIITKDERLDLIAKDIVSHFLGRGYQGKAMVVSIDKVTAGRMYAKVQSRWQAQIAQDKQALTSTTDPLLRDELQTRIRFMEETDMALVVSQSQNEIKQFEAYGLDVRPHRERMITGKLDENFKEAGHPLRLVFVCAMWMTGFDVPSCSTIYLDKPMRNHTLMQTIARANRVYEGKENGLIVDYIGVFRNLQEALAIYAAPSKEESNQAEMPIKEKEALREALAVAIDEAIDYAQEQGVTLPDLVGLTGFSRIGAFDQAQDELMVDDETQNGYLAYARRVNRLFKAVLPDKEANQYMPMRDVIRALEKRILNTRPDVDIDDIRAEVEALIDRSLYVLPPEATADEPFNLSSIDFEGLKKRFQKGQKHVEVNRLRGHLTLTLSSMVRQNPTRLDLQAKLQQIIDDYNAGIIDVALQFERLLALTQAIQEESVRHIRENLTEDELTIFDILRKPPPDLTLEEIDQVKEVARDLLKRLQSLLTIDWYKRSEGRAQVETAVDDVLDELPTSYTDKQYVYKCESVYSHIRRSYEAGLGNF